MTAVSGATPLFGKIEPFAGDPVFALVDMYRADPNPAKVNLSIGVFTNEDGRLPVLDSARTAFERTPFGERPYLPMEGDAAYRAGVQELVLGANHPAREAGRVATIQALGGSGALGIAADFLATHLGAGRTVLTSDPTWENHHGLFRRAGFATGSYRYWSQKTRGVDFAGMLADIEAAPEHSIIIIQPVCHNPTGVDLTEAQQAELTELLLKRNHVAVFDMAYQGFGDGLEADAGFVRRYAARAAGCVISSSFSKNLSLYGERAGALTIVCADATESENALGQLKFAVRRSYSSPPFTAAKIVSTVLTDPALKAQWVGEVEAMRERMVAMRTKLVELISARRQGLDVTFLAAQKGMFAYTGLTKEAVVRLRGRGIYLLESGRLCVAGLTEGNVERVADALCLAYDEM